MSAADILKPGRFHRLFASDAVSVAREPVLLVNLFIGLLLPTLLYFFREQLNQYA